MFFLLVSQPFLEASDLAETIGFFAEVGFLLDDDFFLVTIFAVCEKVCIMIV